MCHWRLRLLKNGFGCVEANHSSKVLASISPKHGTRPNPFPIKSLKQSLNKMNQLIEVGSIARGSTLEPLCTPKVSNVDHSLFRGMLHPLNGSSCQVSDIFQGLLTCIEAQYMVAGSLGEKRPDIFRNSNVTLRLWTRIWGL